MKVFAAKKACPCQVCDRPIIPGHPIKPHPDGWKHCWHRGDVAHVGVMNENTSVYGQTSPREPQGELVDVDEDGTMAARWEEQEALYGPLSSPTPADYESPTAELHRRAEALGVGLHEVSLNDGAEAAKAWHKAVEAARAHRQAAFERQTAE